MTTRQWLTQRHGILSLGILICFIAMALAGIIDAGWLVTPAWTVPHNGRMFAGFCAVAWIVYFGLLAAGVPLIILAFIPACLYIGMAGIGPFVAVAWLWICSALLGERLFRLAGKGSGVTWSLRNAALGFAVVGLGINLLAVAHLCTPILVFSLISANTFAWILVESRRTRLSLPLDLFQGPGRRAVPESVIGALVLLGITLVAIVTFLPDVGHDSLSFHLNIPQQVLVTGGWHFDVKKYIWSVMPFGADWLLVPSYFLAGEQGARLLNSSMLLAVAYGGYLLLLPRIGSLFALALPALLLTLPLSLLEVGSAFIEAPLAFFLFVVFSELTQSDRRGHRCGQWAALAVFAGFACSVKLVSVLILPFVLAGALFVMRKEKFEALSLRIFLQACALFLLFSASPYVMAFLKTGNPVFPFFNSIFRSPLFDTVTSFTNLRFVRPIGVRTWWDMSINAKYFGEFAGQQGALGISLLVLTPFSLLIALIHRRADTLACILATLFYLALCFYNQAYLRYAFPVLPWLLIAGVWSLSTLPAPRTSVTVLVLLLSLIQLWRFPVVHWPFQQFDTAMLTKRGELKNYFNRNKPEAVVGEILSTLESVRGRKILIVGLDPVFKNYPDNTIADSWHSWTAYYAASRSEAQLRPSIVREKVGVIVFPVGRGYRFESEALAMTTELFRVGDVRVGMVDLSMLYVTERLKNPELMANAENWQRNGAQPTADGLGTTVETAITQSVAVKPAENFLLNVTAACPLGQFFRSQINWLDAKRDFISTDIQVHDCQPAGSIVARMVLSPGTAATAVVYGGSHDARAVFMRRISLRSAS